MHIFFQFPCIPNHPSPKRKYTIFSKVIQGSAEWPSHSPPQPRHHLFLRLQSFVPYLLPFTYLGRYYGSMRRVGVGERQCRQCLWREVAKHVQINVPRCHILTAWVFQLFSLSWWECSSLTWEEEAGNDGGDVDGFRECHTETHLFKILYYGSG